MPSEKALKEKQQKKKYFSFVDIVNKILNPPYQFSSYLVLTLNFNKRFVYSPILCNTFATICSAVSFLSITSFAFFVASFLLSPKLVKTITASSTA